MPTREQLESALMNADKVGDIQAARMLANALKNGEFDEATKPEAEPQTKTNDSYGLNLAREALQGLTFGFSDEAGAGLAALAASLTSDAKFSDAYNDIIKNVRGEQNAFREENPISSAGAQLVGGIASGGAGLAKAANALAPVGSSIAKSALVGSGAGAIEGGIAGAGFADEDKLEGAKTGTLIGAGTGFVGGGLGGYFSKRSALKDELANLFENDGQNIKLAKYIKDGTGKIKTDRLAQHVVKQGYDEAVVAAIKGSGKADKAKMRRMLATLERGKENAKFAALNRPSDVVGDSVAQRIKYIERVNSLAGKRVKAASQRLKGQDVDFQPAVNELLGDLDELGVKFDPSSGAINFTGSDFEALSGAEGAIKRVLERMRTGGKPDAYDVHRLKKYIDNNVEFGRSEGGAIGQAERVIKRLRRNMDTALDGKFKAYDEANTTFSKTKEALDAIQKAAGASIEFDSPNLNKSLGVLSRRLMSNVQSRTRLLDSIQMLEDVAAANGAKFDDDIITQALFADELNSVFGAAARTSLQGEGEKVARHAARAANGSVVDMGLEAAGKAYDSVRGVNDEQAIKTMKALLNR